MTSKTRTEKDSLGVREVPGEAYYGAQTSRSLENFPFGEALPMAVVRGMAQVKAAAAVANMRSGRLDGRLGAAIVAALEEVVAGKFDGEFAVSVYQAGSGTSSHMNLNEVAANRANEMLGGARGEKRPVHPNDHVNMGQSTNNVFPSGAKVAVWLEGLPAARRGLGRLAKALRGKERAFAGVMKTGRTHLQDAVPITLGQEFGAWAEAVERALGRLETAADALLDLGAGGNAVGTGVNTRADFRRELVRALRSRTGAKWRAAKDAVQATQIMSDFAWFSGAVRAAALDVGQVANNLRLLGSGPNSGLGEIELPPVEPGSSIMPGKVNPSICESANMAVMRVAGLDASVAAACGAGQLELNTHMPLIAAGVLEELELLGAAAGNLAERCVKGIRARKDRCAAGLERSAGLATVLNPALGYDRVAELVKEGLARGMSLKELALEKGLLDEAGYRKLVGGATRPNLK